MTPLLQQDIKGINQTTNNIGHHNKDRYLDLGGIANSRSNDRVPSTVSMSKLESSNPKQSGVFIYLGKTDQEVCPITAMLPYLVIRGKTQGALVTEEC